MAINKSFNSRTSDNHIKFNVTEVIKRMTLKEKAQLMIGTGQFLPLPDSVLEQLPEKPKDNLDTNTLYGKMVKKIRQYLPGAAGSSAEFPQYGITSQNLADGPAGLRISPTREGQDSTYYATAFPIGTLLASTWDTKLINEVGQAMGKEVLEYGADILLAPALNLQRDPLNGRNFEYYSEDPLVSGKISAAMVNGIQSNGVGTSIKHFAVNNQETNRLTVNTILSERALRELYLRGFEIAVRGSNPWTVMSSYNKINGKYTSEDFDLLVTILRKEWGFNGYVMTDWGGGSDLIAQLQSGNDMIQPGSPEQIEEVVDAVQSGRLKESVLDKNVGGILDIMKCTPRFNGYQPSNQPDLKAHAKIARKAASEGMILLENKDNALPFDQSIKNIAAFGANSYDFISCGTGSGDVNQAYTISLIKGLKSAQYTIDDELKTIYEHYIKQTEENQIKPENDLTILLGGKVPVPEMQLDIDMAKGMAKTNDIALITIGRNAGEGEDRKAEAGDFYLTKTELLMIKNVSDAFQAEGKKAIVILNIAGVIETESWKKIPDAILCAWLPGQEAGHAVVDILSGKTNPSGKLAATFPKTYEDTSTSDYFPGYAVQGEIDDKKDESGFSFMKREPWEVVYQEDIFVGYRYFQSFNIPTSYEFGYGQSYTTFKYFDLQLDKVNFEDTVDISVCIKNTGTTSGKEAVQIYNSAPNKKLVKPKSELIAFGKTSILKPGESEILKFNISAKDIASFDEENSSWVVESGDYTLKVGASSKNIRLKQNYKVKNDIIVETVHKALSPKRKIEVLRP